MIMGKREIRNKKMKKIVVIGAAVMVLVAVIVAIAVVPTAIIENNFENIFERAENMLNPQIFITDMSAENNFSGAKGEMLVTEEAAIHMIENLADVADDFEYVGKENAAGSFDIRYKIYEGENAIEIYLSKDGMYYVNGDKKYVFVPEDAETRIEYKKIYNTACMFVK